MKMFLKNTIVFYITLSTLILNTSQAQQATSLHAITISGFPFIFPGITYLDSRLQYEHSLAKDFYLAGGITYKRENFPDADIPFATKAIGPNVYVKYFFSDWFINAGLDYLSVRVHNKLRNTQTEGTTFATRLIVGNRATIAGSFFYEMGLGASYYFKEIKDQTDSKGYKEGLLPAFHLGLGIGF